MTKRRTQNYVSAKTRKSQEVIKMNAKVTEYLQMTEMHSQTSTGNKIIQNLERERENIT